MRRLNGSYTQRFTWRHQRVSHLLQGRFKSLVVERESYLLELCRYVVLNPVRAGLVSAPQDWVWSSYGATAGIQTAPPWLDVAGVLDLFDPDHARASAGLPPIRGTGDGEPVSLDAHYRPDLFRQSCLSRTHGHTGAPGATGERAPHPNRPLRLGPKLVRQVGEMESKFTGFRVGDIAPQGFADHGKGHRLPGNL